MSAFNIITKPVGNLFLIDASVVQNILDNVEHELASIKKDYERSASTWEKEHPVFVSETKISKDEIEASVGTYHKIWSILNYGTKDRWAIMSEDWESKTSPDSYTSKIGSGYVVARGKKYFEQKKMPPRPGILPRNWVKNSEDRLEKKLKSASADFDIMVNFVDAGSIGVSFSTKNATQQGAVSFIKSKHASHASNVRWGRQALQSGKELTVAQTAALIKIGEL